jgi:hypothetical protein
MNLSIKDTLLFQAKAFIAGDPLLYQVSNELDAQLVTPLTVHPSASPQAKVFSGTLFQGIFNHAP